MLKSIKTDNIIPFHQFKSLWMACALAVFWGFTILLAPGPGHAASWLVVDIGIIGVASQDILETSLQQTQADKHSGLLIRLDTPGGSLDSTRSMVKSIMASQVPVVVWVGPSGSRAASAGSFITLAAHVAAMAPGTNIGAAHPVSLTGDGENDSEIKRKAENDTEAFMESIAQTRQRNIEMARSFVTTSVSITAEQAKEHQVIDVIAKDINDLLSQIHGREVMLDSLQKIVLDTHNAQLVVFEKSYRQLLLEILSNPNFFYLLFLCGLIGLGYELTHPGLILPGVAGAISLILALVATSVLPIHFGALALMLTGIVFLVAEAFIPSFGALGIGGFLAFVLGSIFLVDPMNVEGLRISLFTIIPGALVIGATFFGLGYLVFRSLNSRVQSGAEALVGVDCVVLEDFVNDRGQVRAQGAIWSASLVSPLEEGQEPIRKNDVLRVVRRQDLMLVVARKT